MSGEGEVLSIEDYMAQGFTRVQAIKKHYEALKQHGGPTNQTTAAETNREQLQKRYEEIQKLNEQKGFVKTAIRSVNVERRLSQRLGDFTYDDNEETQEEEPVTEDKKQVLEPPKVEEPNRSINTQAPRAPSPANAPSSTRSVESKLFQALEEVESRSGLSKLSSARDILSADTLDDEYSDDDDEDEDDPFPHFVDTTSVDPDDVKAPVKIELQSSEPTMDNISSFIHQSDYNEDEVKEFHFLIDQGFNIDEASDLVYQRRLNAYNDEPPAGAAPSSSNKMPGALTPPPPPSYETAVSSPSPTSMMGGGNTIFSAGSLSPPPSYTAAMAMSQPLQHQQQQQQHHNFLQPPPPYNQRIGSRSPLMHHPQQQQQQQPPFHHPQHMHQRMAPVPTQIKRIPLRANALSGNKEADLRQLIERGYTFEQATEICDIIYAERMAEEEQQRQQQGFDQRAGAGPHGGNVMSVAGSSMSSGGLKKKRSGRKANNNRKMMQNFQQLPSNHYPDVEALKLALLVSEQEAEYGVNMYDSLQPEDEDIIADYMSQGYTLDEAVFEVFTSKMGNVSNNKVRQLSGSGNGPSGALRSLMTANTGNGMSGSGSPNPRNLLIPVRDTPASSRDSPTIQMTGGGGGGGIGTGSSTPVNNSSNNSNRNSFVGGNPGPSQPTPTRMTQPVRIPANSPAMMAPGIQQSFVPNQNSPSNAQGGNMHSMMRKAGIPGISTPPVVQLAQSPAAGGPMMFPGAPMDDHGGVDPSNMMVDHGHHVDFDEMDEMGGMMLGPNGEMIDMNMMMDMMMMPPNAAAAAFDVDYTAAKNIENEIELLMMTGYTRESAVRFLLEKAKRETPAMPMPRSRMNSGRMVGPPPLPAMVEDDMPLPVPTEIQIKDSDHMTVTSDLTGSVIMSVASSQRNKAREQGGYSEYMSPRELPPPSSSHLKYYGNDGLYQPMAGAYPSGNVHGGYGGGNNNNSNNHLMHQINEADNEDEEYDDYVEEAAIDLKHMYPYMGYEGVYNRQPHRNIFNLYEEERALKVGILISQQSATFDTNMYESITPEDEPMINSLLALGFDEDETYLIIFERKFGPPGIGERSVRSIPSQPSSSKKHMMRHGDIEIDNASTESMQRILRMSRHEHEQKPGAVKMPGYQSSANAAGGNNSGNNNANSNSNNNNHHHHHQGNVGGGNVDYSDINPRNMEVLVSMGFTVEEVAHALRVNAYDLHSAAQYLLGGA